MEGINRAIELITKDCFLASVDLEKAYYSVPIAERHKKYLRFRFKDQTFEYSCLPNGVSMAPRLFSKIIRVIFGQLRNLGHSSVICTDDSLLVAKTPEDCRNNISDTIGIMQKAGFYVNWSKSSHEPRQELEFLGFIVLSKNMTISLSDKKGWTILK